MTVWAIKIITDLINTLELSNDLIFIDKNVWQILNSHFLLYQLSYFPHPWSPEIWPEWYYAYYIHKIIQKHQDLDICWAAYKDQPVWKYSIENIFTKF